MEAKETLVPAPLGGLNHYEPEYGLSPAFAKVLVNLEVQDKILVPRPPIYGMGSGGVASESADVYQYLLAFTPSDVNAGNAGLAFVKWGGSGAPEADSLAFGDLNVNWATGSGTLDVRNMVSHQWNEYLWCTAPGRSAPLAAGRDASGSAITFSGLPSGVTESELTGAFGFKGRLYWWSDTDASFMYSDLGDGTTQTLTAFPIRTLTRRSGLPLQITSLSADGGAGQDDLFVILTVDGEMLVYQGSDPGSTYDWSIVGRYDTPPPVNSHSAVLMGSDTIVLSRQGLYSLKSIMQNGGGLQQDGAWQQAINPAIRRWFKRYPGGNGVLRFCPDNRKLILMLMTERNGSGFIDDGLCFVLNTENFTWTEYAWPEDIDDLSGYDRDVVGADIARNWMALDAVEYDGRVWFTFQNGDGDASAIGWLFDVNYTAGITPASTTRIRRDFAVNDIECYWRTGYIPTEPQTHLQNAQMRYFWGQEAGSTDEVATLLDFKFLVGTDQGGVASQYAVDGAAAGKSDMPTGTFPLAGSGDTFQFAVSFSFRHGNDWSWNRIDAMRLYGFEVQTDNGGLL